MLIDIESESVPAITGVAVGGVFGYGFGMIRALRLGCSLSSAATYVEGRVFSTAGMYAGAFAGTVVNVLNEHGIH